MTSKLYFRGAVYQCLYCFAPVAKLAYALDLGSSVFIRVGSSPIGCIIFFSSYNDRNAKGGAYVDRYNDQVGMTCWLFLKKLKEVASGFDDSKTYTNDEIVATACEILGETMPYIDNCIEAVYRDGS